MKLTRVKNAIKTAAVVICCVTASAAADTQLDCTYDGYVAMGGMVFNTTNSYLLPGNPNSEPSGTMATFGYAVLKFDSAALPTSAVTQAYLQVETMGLQDGMSWPVDGTASLSALAVSSDVESLSAASAGSFMDSFADSASDTISISTAGIYTLDVTDIVNEWIASGSNTGLVLTTPGGLMPRLCSSASTEGAAAVINIVPEPASLSLMALGAAAIARRRRRS